MKQFLIGLFLGICLATTFTVYAQTRSTSPYAPGNFMSDTLLYDQMISQDADQALRSMSGLGGSGLSGIDVYTPLSRPCGR